MTRYKVFLCISIVNLVATVALARNLVDLLHSNSAEKSKKQLILPLCFKIASKKLHKLQTYTVFCCMSLHNWLLLWWRGRNSTPAHPLITEDTPKTQFDNSQLSTRTKTAQHNEEGQKFLCIFPIHSYYMYIIITQTHIAIAS